MFVYIYAQRIKLNLNININTKFCKQNYKEENTIFICIKQS